MMRFGEGKHLLNAYPPRFAGATLAISKNHVKRARGNMAQRFLDHKR